MRWLEARTAKLEWQDWVMLIFRGIVLVSVLYNVSMVQEQLCIPFWVVDVGIGLSFIVPFLLLQRNRMLYLIGELFFILVLTPFLAPIDGTAAGNLVSYVLGVGFYHEASSRRWSIPVTAAVLLLAPIPVLLENPITYVSIVISGAVFYALGLMINAMLSAKKELQRKNETIELQNRTLKQYAKQVEQNTVLQERNRISTGLQVSVSHIFASLMVQLESFRELSSNQAEPQIRQLTEQIRHGLQQVREAVEQLEPLDIELSLIGSCQAIIDDFRKESGRNVLFTVKGEEPELSKQTVLTFTRCLQELLTCSVQTGHAQTVGVTLQFTDAELELRVEDDGTGSEKDRFEAGLTGLVEPLSLLKGECAVTSFLNKGMTAVCKAPITKEREKQKIKVLIVESNPLIRESLLTLLQLHDAMEIVGHASSGTSALQICKEKKPDVILLDVTVDHEDTGFHLTCQMKQIFPETRIMIMANEDHIDEAVASIDAGAEGYIGKSSSLQDLAAKIQLLHMGETIISPSVAKQLISRSRSTDAEKHQHEGWKQKYGLTDREAEVLQLLAEGLKYKDISERLFLAEGTVRNYISSIYSKLEVKDRDEAMRKAIGV